ncbi:MAG TPA: hypothetical protein VFO41_08825 [Alphaproteobacteria bacterium]|nr:hypothetical protein [Alphaproteobacteria bacterium]
MTDTPLPPLDDGTTERRLTEVATGLRHFREIYEIRDRQVRDAIAELQERNQRQDSAIEVMEEKLLGKIEKIYELLWSGMKWLGTLLAMTLLAIILKALNLY